jgi:4-alpha-glucanotransferase
MDKTELSNYLTKTASASHWEKIGVKKRAGILFPLFSLKTKNNFGIGEFPDIQLLIDWCNLTGHSVIQFLPVNDTGLFNFPYSSISAYALNPLYLSPLKMDGTISIRQLQKHIPEIKEKRETLKIN